MLEDADGDYQFYGSFVIKGWLNGLNSVGGSKEATNCKLKLKDGTIYTFEYPLMIVKNISVGSQYQVYMHKIEINDITNNYAAIIHYNPYTDNSYTTMFKKGFSFGFGKKAPEKPVDAKPERGDDIVISIVKRDPKDKNNDKELAKGEGSWLSHIIFEE